MWAGVGLNTDVIELLKKPRSLAFRYCFPQLSQRGTSLNLNASLACLRLEDAAVFPRLGLARLK